MKGGRSELIRTLLIVQLRQADVPQGNIQKIAKCDLTRINAISKLLKVKAKKAKKVKR